MNDFERRLGAWAVVNHLGSANTDVNSLVCQLKSVKQSSLRVTAVIEMFKLMVWGKGVLATTMQLLVLVLDIDPLTPASGQSLRRTPHHWW